MLAAEIWHWWLGLLLTLGAVAAVIGVIVGYLNTVVRPQYPNRHQRSSDANSET
jgi:hypothetical protein